MKGRWTPGARRRARRPAARGGGIARRTSASWHRAFWASRLSDRSACCFEIRRIWLLCRHGRFSKEKPGTSRTAIFREAKNADTTMSSTTRHVGSDRAAAAA